MSQLEDKRILDIGCGVGAFVRRLREFSADVYGTDIDAERVREGSEKVPNLGLAVGEHLPFADETFDVIVLHEVLEHVTDDLATLREARRVLTPGVKVVIFCPNRLYPFETHGIFLGKRYVFGNMPLVGYLPDAIRDRLVPHARAYTKGGLRRIYRRAGLRAAPPLLRLSGLRPHNGAPQDRRARCCARSSIRWRTARSESLGCLTSLF